MSFVMSDFDSLPPAAKIELLEEENRLLRHAMEDIVAILLPTYESLVWPWSDHPDQNGSSTEDGAADGGGG
jgi:hypothetical protein